MTVTATITKKKNVKTQAESIGEFGSVSLKRTAKACIPSKDNLDAIAKLEAECKELQKLIEDASNSTVANPAMPEAAIPYAKQALDGKLYKVAMMRANIGNPANLSERDRLMLTIAAKRLLKYGLADILSTAVFVESNADKFPVKGTKY